MKTKQRLLAFGMIILANIVGFNSMAQDTNETGSSLSLGLPALALIKTDAAPINLTLTTTVAGEMVAASVTNTAARIKVTSIIAGTGTRSISGAVTAGTPPANTYLKMTPIVNPAPNFVGTSGNVTAVEYDLTSGVAAGSKEIVTGIGSCYSGTTPTDGYAIKYEFGILNAGAFGDIRATAGAAMTVTFTISDESVI